MEKPENQKDRNAKQAEAWAIAAKIKELLEDFQITDKETGSLRPVRFSDIVILLRTNSGWDEEFKKVLEEEGIPAYVTSKTGYFAAPEVQELLQLLKVLDNPTQDIPLFGVILGIIGVTQARMGSGSSKAGMAKAGKVLGIIGICIAVAGWLLNIVLTVALF